MSNYRCSWCLRSARFRNLFRVVKSTVKDDIIMDRRYGEGEVGFWEPHQTRCRELWPPALLEQKRRIFL